MGYLIVVAYLGFGIYFNYTPGDWVVGAVIWGIVYFSGATDNLSDSHKKADNKAIESEPEVSPIPPKQVKENPYKIDSVESANKFEEHYFDKTLKTLPKLSSDELREVGDFFFKVRNGEFDKVESNDRDAVQGTFKEIKQTIKNDRPNHLVIIQNGFFYEALDEDAEFFVDKFSYNAFDWKGVTKTGFPVHSEKVFSDLREMKKSFVLVSQLPKVEGEKVRRAVSDIYDGDITVNDNNPSNSHDCDLTIEDNIPNYIENPCIECGCEIPQARLDNVDGVVRCAACQSRFETDNPDSIARKVEETLGTREDFKNMSKRQYGINIKNKS